MPILVGVRVHMSVPIVVRVSVCIVVCVRTAGAMTMSNDRPIGLDMNVLTAAFTFHGDTRLVRTAARSTHHDTSSSVTRSSSPPVISN